MVQKFFLQNKFHRSCKGDVFDIPPIWMMRQAGRYLEEYRALREKEKDFLNFCFNKQSVNTVTLQPIERFDFDAAIIFSDILVIPHALGQTVKFESGEGPRLIPFERNFLESDPFPVLEPVYEAISLVRENLDPSKSLIGFAGTPWTLAAYMIACQKIGDGRRLLEEVSGFEDLTPLMDVLTKNVAIHLINQIRAGADVVQLFDSWASLCPLDKGRYLLEPLRAILKMVWDVFPETPIIYYGRMVSDLYADLKDIKGPLVFGVDQHASLREALELQRPLQGNLDPDILIKGGEALQNAVNDILKITKGSPFIFNLGHGIKPETPVQNVESMIKLVRGGG